MVIVPEEGIVEQPTLVLPIRDHEGTLSGVAELSDGDEVELPHPETLALIELFLTLTAQSVEQFRLERELEESEASYRSLIDNVGDVIFRIERDGKLNFVSRQVSTLLGEHWRQVLGRSFFELLNAQHNAELVAVFPYLLEGHFHTRDLIFVRPDGVEVIAYVSLNPITEHGAITGVMAVARDVTEKRRLEKQIEESEQRYRALTENAYDAIILIDPESYRIVEANPQALKLVGYEHDEFIGKSVFEIRHPEQAHQVVERITEVMASGSGRFEDVPIVRQDGTAVFVDTAASVFEIQGRKFYQAILRDMSMQREMTAALNQRVLELQILVEVSDALQSSVDLPSVMGIVLAGVTAGSGLGFNRAFILSYDKERDMLHGEAGVGPRSAEDAGRIWAEVEAKGLTLAEMMQQRLRRLPQEIEDEAHYARALQVSLDNPLNPFFRAIRDRDAVFVDLDQHEFEVTSQFIEAYGARIFAVVPLVTRDDVLGVLLVDNRFSGAPIDQDDVTRLKLFANSAASAMDRGKLLVSLERRLHEITLANQHLKESRDRLLRTERLTAIGEVAASVAHEIRNPLAAIGGFARSVFGSLDDDDRNKSKMGIIVEETERLDTILNAILEFSRPTAPRFAAVDVNGLILQTVHFMDAEIDDTLIKVECALDDQMPAAWADAGQIRQVFLNVLRNAVQEMPGGGELRISSKHAGATVLITISDSGPGIPPDKLERIFDAFFTTKPTGSGLGLSICSQIVRNHNGRLEARSEQGAGAAFHITLPIAQ
jgi:PAS domain S-box-containing protein